MDGGTSEAPAGGSSNIDRIGELERKVDTLLAAINANASVLQMLSTRNLSVQGQPAIDCIRTAKAVDTTDIGSPENAGYRKARAQVARERIRERRYRDRIFSPEYFADPAWDMLLDLYAAHYEGHQVSVSSLCIAASVPSTTALRWIRTMSDAGFLERSRDDADGRRIFIHLSAEARQKLDQYFDVLKY
ncbi:MAG: winged helix DNA-binding protein [Sphingopyxis sp.]|nr:winged helix DNA-binding protein [Sphingopyxis sp.]